jgi:hypothetical protein
LNFCAQSPAAPRPKSELALRWALFFYLSWIFCPIRYCAPDRLTAENTWFFALNYAAAHHLTFGRDFVWTWGPLAYLLVPFHLGDNLWHALIFQAMLWTLLAFAFWDLSIRADFPARNLQLFTLFMVIYAVNFSMEVNPNNPLLPLALIFLVQYHLRGGVPRLLLALTVLGIMPLFQFAGSIPAAGIVIGFVVYCLIDRHQGSLREAILAIVVPFTVAILGGWSTLGSFSAALAYAKSSQELAKGYVTAMSLPGASGQIHFILAAFVLFVLILVLFALLSGKTGRFLALVLTVPVIFELRHAVVRQDNSHVDEFFSFLALALALVALAIPVHRRFVETAAGITFCALFALSWEAGTLNFPRIASAAIGRRIPERLWNVAHYPALVRSLQDAARRNYDEYALPPKLQQTVGDQPVAFLSYLYSHVAGTDLNLVLFPIPQNYALYTPYLDDRNAEWLSSSGPKFLIHESVVIDDRHAWTEAPATWAAVYRWYDTRALDGRYLLLQRRSHPRFGHFSSFETRTIRFGDEIPIPESDEPVFWSLGCSLSLEGRLRAVIVRIPEITMTVNFTNDLKLRYRTLLAVTGTPSMGNRLPVDLAHFADIFRDPATANFNVRTLQFAGPGASSYQQECKLEFLRIEN